MSAPVIVAKGLGKRYDLAVGPRAATLRDAVTEAASAPLRWLRGASPGTEEFWAVRDLGFEVRDGEAVAIIGRNGAGKSTLLKILSRITEPTTGFAEIRGRLGALLEVGTGFHPELTGRENIFLNGSILGLGRDEIRARFDAIVDFSGVEKFLDTPVKHYSTGMYVRLGFAVAAHLEPTVLLIDEVLAVGDAAFQKKCLGKMSEVQRSGRTILFVSHSLSAVQALCSRALVLDAGRIVFDGKTGDAIASYLAAQVALAKRSLRDRKDRHGDGALRFVDAHVEDSSGAVVETLRSGEEARLVVRYSAPAPVTGSIQVALNLRGVLGEPLADLWSEGAGAAWSGGPAEGTLVCSLPRLPLNAGRYTFNVHGVVNGVVADHVDDAAAFDVIGGDFFGTGKHPDPKDGCFLFEQKWKLE